MKMSDFAAKFTATAKEVEPACAAAIPGLPAEVTIAGTVLAVHKDGFRVDVNGARYEIPTDDISDVQLLSAVASGKGDGADVAQVTEKDLVLFKVNSNATVTLCVPVQAAAVAAAGIWVAATPAAKAPEAK